MTRQAVDKLIKTFDQMAADTTNRLQCGVKLLMAEMQPDEVEAFQAAMDDPRYMHTVICRTLKGWGYSITPSIVGRHRKHECRCHG